MRPQLNPILLGVGAPWSYPGSSLDFQFTTGRAAVNRQKASISSLLTTTRASTGYAATSTGSLTLFPTNTPRITDLGLLVEQAATNLALWNRDLTNANWTKSNITAALDQTGMDGSANAASSLTATSTNGTATAAAITSASASRTVTMGVQRITGSGAVSISQDGGATFTAITTKVGASWYIPTPSDFAGLTQTVTNPQIVIKLGTSGDKIAVDFVDLEAGAFNSSPIATTTVAVTRAADVILVNNSANYLGSGSWSALATVTGNARPASNATPFSMDDGSTTNMFYTFALSSSLNMRYQARGPGSSGTTGGIGYSGTVGVPFKIGVIGRPGLASFFITGGASIASVIAPTAALNRILIGSDAFTADQFNGLITRLTVWRSDIGNAAMTALGQ